MNTLINEVNQSGKFGIPPGNETHWTFDWYQPIKPTSNNNNDNGTNNSDNNFQSINDFIFGSKDHDGSRTNLNKSNSNVSLTDDIIQQQFEHHTNSNMPAGTTEKYLFSFKTWLKSTKNDFEFFDLEENNTLKALDLHKFDRSQGLIDDKDQKMIALEKNKRIKEHGLTEKDIRGAVTNAGSIPGLSSSTDSNNSGNTTKTSGTHTDTSDKNFETTKDNNNNNNNIIDEENDSNKQSTNNNNTDSNEQVVSSEEKTTLPVQTLDTITNENQSVEPSNSLRTTTDNPINTDKEGDIEMK